MLLGLAIPGAARSWANGSETAVDRWCDARNFLLWGLDPRRELRLWQVVCGQPRLTAQHRCRGGEVAGGQAIGPVGLLCCFDVEIGKADIVVILVLGA